MTTTGPSHHPRRDPLNSLPIPRLERGRCLCTSLPGALGSFGFSSLPSPARGSYLQLPTCKKQPPTPVLARPSLLSHAPPCSPEEPRAPRCFRSLGSSLTAQLLLCPAAVTHCCHNLGPFLQTSAQNNSWLLWSLPETQQPLPGMTNPLRRGILKPTPVCWGSYSCQGRLRAHTALP